MSHYENSSSQAAAANSDEDSFCSPSLFDDPSLFDPHSSVPKQSMWSKNVPLLPKRTHLRSAEGVLFKYSHVKNGWKQFRFELIGSKLIRFQSSGSIQSQQQSSSSQQTLLGMKRPDKYMCIENFRLEQIEYSYMNMPQQSQQSQQLRFGIRLTQNEQSVELVARSEEDRQAWYEALRKHCVLTTFSDDFAIIRVMGKGNFAKVYYARSRKAGAEVAVKAFEKEKLRSLDVDRASLIKEISILRKLNHPGVIKLYDVYENESHVFLVSELLKGGELLVKLKERGSFSETAVAKIVKTLLESLKYLVEKNIMHRDIKPENLILREKSKVMSSSSCTSIVSNSNIYGDSSTQDGVGESEENMQVVLADFGLAEFFDEKGGYMFNRCGTPGYVAPEVLADKLYDFRVDCFSVGVIMFVLLTGYSPFKGKSYDEIVIKNYNCEINFEFPENIVLSHHCLDLLKKLLKKDPSQRYCAEEALRHPWILALNQSSQHFISHTSIKCSERNQNSAQPISQSNNHTVNNLHLQQTQQQQQQQQSPMQVPLMKIPLISQLSGNNSPLESSRSPAGRMQLNRLVGLQLKTRSPMYMMNSGMSSNSSKWDSPKAQNQQQQQQQQQHFSPMPWKNSPSNHLSPTNNHLSPSQWFQNFCDVRDLYNNNDSQVNKFTGISNSAAAAAAAGTGSTTDSPKAAFTPVKSSFHSPKNTSMLKSTLAASAAAAAAVAAAAAASQAAVLQQEIIHNYSNSSGSYGKSKDVYALATAGGGQIAKSLFGSETKPAPTRKLSTGNNNVVVGGGGGGISSPLMEAQKPKNKSSYTHGMVNGKKSQSLYSLVQNQKNNIRERLIENI